MRRKPESLKRKALSLWLDGYDYRTIRELTGISLGKLSEIVGGARKMNPDLDELRQLNKLVKEGGLSVGKARVGLRLLAELRALNIGEEEAGQAVAQIASYGEEAPKILAEAKALLDLETQTGTKYSEVAADYRRKAKAIPELTKRVEALKDKCEELQSSITDLEGLRKLQDKLHQRNITIQRMGRFIDDSLKLEERGFTPAVAETLSSELAKYGLNAKEAAETLAESMAKYRALGEGISGRGKRLEQLNEEVMEAERQLETLLSRRDAVKKDIEAKNKFLSDLKAGMTTKILELKSDYSNRKRELEEQFSKKEAELNERIKQKKQELQSLIQRAEEEPKRRKTQLEEEANALENEVQKLREERETLQRDVDNLRTSLKGIREEVEEIEKRVRAQEPLAKLNALLTNPEASLQRENLEPLITILDKVVSNSGLGNLWRLADPQKMQRCEGLIQDLAHEVRSE